MLNHETHYLALNKENKQKHAQILNYGKQDGQKGTFWKMNIKYAMFASSSGITVRETDVCPK